MNRFILSLGVSFLALSTAATAQQVSTDDGDVVVVTAQKREQTLNEVPFAVSVIDPEQLNTIFTGGGDILQLANRVPGLFADSSNGRYAPRFYIRGFGNVDFDLTASQPVSVVQDEVVYENVFLKSFPLFDVAQVEVLRGPQGTLFGRNTPAGVIKFDTVKPGDEFSANVTASYGSFSTTRIEAGVTQPLSDTFSVRVAGLINYRDDYVNNANAAAPFVDPNGDELGGYRDVAARLHALWTPNDQFTALFSVQNRSLDGTSSLFRANILDLGSNDLNSRFDRDTVFYDGGRNNFQTQDTFNTNLRLDYDFGGMTLTSITGAFWGDSTGLGDIDGGLVGATPQTGFVPFPSETGSLGSDLEQYSQEFRLASNTDEPLQWILGAFYFEDDFNVDSVAFNGFGDPTPTIITNVAQEQSAWALFGQLSYDFTEALNLTGGLRYSNDDKSYTGVRTRGFLGPLTVTEDVSDSEVSWDVSATYAISDTTTVYGRVAQGYRGPSIQGRITFSSDVTTADSETILSWEAGVRTAFLNDTLDVSASIYTYEVDDQQFTAIGGATNTNRLVNAEGGRGTGLELEGTWRPVESLTFTGALSINDTEIEDESLRVPPCGAGCTVTDPLDANGLALVDGNPFPQAPDYQFNFTAEYTQPAFNGEVYIHTDWFFQGETNFFLYESAEFNSDGNFEGGLRLGYRDARGYEAALFARNITDEENLFGGIDFNNLTGFVNEPRVIGIELRGEWN